MQIICNNPCMSLLTYIIIFTLIGSIGSLVGGLLLLYKQNYAVKISHYLTAFAAGTLLGAAFFDLLPEALHEAEHAGAETDVFLWTLVGMLGLFLVERFIHWYHHHHVFKFLSHKNERGESEPVVPLLILGDTLHNFIDGVVIALTFMASIPVGIVTTIAVAAHEIPQEIGDFGVMIHKGVSRKKVLLVNIFSAIAALGGALLAYSFADLIEGFLPATLAIAAGFFIYISASDLIPEIHNEEKKEVAFVETILLFIGVFVVWFAISFLEH